MKASNGRLVVLLLVEDGATDDPEMLVEQSSV
jgi:hypothetical protein